MQLLADRLIELQQVETIFHDTVRRTLKKRPQALTAQRLWCIPSVSLAYA